jgi:radical SAM protein with 4Fe4S-binding SPASM domain
MDFDGLPLVMGWELTLSCNLRCRHCGSSAGSARRRELSLVEALDICEQFPALLVQEVDFTGGEPLLNPNWSRIASRLTALGINTKIITNGLAITPRAVAEMQDVGIAGVGFSLDGVEATHDAIRGQAGVYRRLIAGMERVLNAGLAVTVITTITALNAQELPALLELLRALGVSRWQLQPLFPLGRGRDACDLRFREAEFAALKPLVQAWAYRPDETGVLVTPADSLGYLPADEAPAGVMWHGCPAGRVSCGITSDGKVKGCLSLPDEVIEGDLRERDLWDIWFDPFAFPYTRGFCVDALGPNCRGCDLGEICRGGCSAMSYGSTGAFHNDPFCFHGWSRRNPGSSSSMAPGERYCCIP